MAVISELIDAGLELKAQGKQDAAIEHFRQLQETYPDNARIMFELAATWGAFDVPEQALPLYRALLELPKSKALPPRDMPRLYARLAATLFTMRDYGEALAVVEEGLRLHPSYRPLRAFRIFSQYRDGRADSALVDALDMMLESLAPSRWDVMEDEIKAIVGDMRESIAGAEIDKRADDVQAEPKEAPAPESAEEAIVGVASVEIDIDEGGQDDAASEAEAAAVSSQIAVADTSDQADDFELEVKVKSSSRKSGKKRGKSRKGKQLGDKRVRINISSGEGAEAADMVEADDADEDAGAAKVNIPIDFD